MIFRLPGGVATRMAAREVSRHKARSVLISALVALPVGAVLGLSLYFSAFVNPSRPSVEFGTGSAVVESMAGPKGCHQDSFTSAQCGDGGSPGTAPPVSFAPLGALGLPTLHQETALLLGVVAGGDSSIAVTVVDLADPHAAEWFHGPSTNPAASEVFATARFAKDFGLRAEDVIRVGKRSYTIAAVVRTDGIEDALIVGPGHPLAAAVGASPHRAQKSYLYGAEPTPGQVHRLNDAGLGVTLRSAWTEMVERGGMAEETTWQAIALGVGLALGVLVSTIVGAAFTIGVQQQRRSLALLAATGAPGSVLKRVVVSQGVVLGLAGGLVGSGVGIVLGRVVHEFADRGEVGMPTHVHLLWPVLVGALLLGVLVSAFAAWLPARQVARTDVLVGIREATAAEVAPRRPWIGLALILTGLLVGIGGTWVLTSGQRRSDGTVPVELSVMPASAGLVLAFVGTLLCTGWALALLGRRGRGPLAWRMALRDAARHRSRAVACTAACLAIFTIAGTVVVANDSIAATQISHYVETVPAGTVAVPLRSADQPRAATAPQVDRVAKVAEAAIAPVTARATQQEPQVCSTLGIGPSACTNSLVLQPWPAGGDSAGLPSLAVWSPELHRALTGDEPSGSLRQAVDGGAVVVFDPALVDAGRAQVQYQPGDGGERAATTVVPAVLARTSLRPTYALASAATIRRLAPAATLRPTTALLSTGHAPSNGQIDAFRRGMADANLGELAATTAIEPGPHSGYSSATPWFALVFAALSLAVAAVAAALSLHDARGSQRALAAIGASTRTL